MLNQKIIFIVVLLLLSASSLVFANLCIKTNKKEMSNPLPCEKEYVYNGNEKKINVMVRTIHSDSERTIQILQIKGHEYIVYLHKWKASIAMVHDQNCFRCQMEKNGK